jgi:hypothetical protein
MMKQPRLIVGFLSAVVLLTASARAEEGKKLIDVVIHGGNIFDRTFLLPPGVPKDRVAILKQAFAKTMQGPEFLALLSPARSWSGG